MRGNDIVTHCQPKTSATFLGAEEWLEDIVPSALRNAGTGILENDFNPVLVLAGTDDQLSTSRHGIQRVQNQVEKDLLDLTAHRIDSGEGFGQICFDFNLTLPQLL